MIITPKKFEITLTIKNAKKFVNYSLSKKTADINKMPLAKKKIKSKNLFILNSKMSKSSYSLLSL